jgi:16S rRNA G1207 methylase RsmC
MIARRSATTAIDIGCSVGFTTMYGARRNPQVHILGIDTNTEAIAIASRLPATSPSSGRATFRCAAYSDLGSQKFEVAFANPPYIPNLLGLPGMDPSAVGEALLLELISDPARHLVAGGRLVLILSSASHTSSLVSARLKALRSLGRARRLTRKTVPFRVSCVLSSHAFTFELERRAGIVRSARGFDHDIELWEFQDR